MSYQVFFEFSTGLETSLQVPTGTMRGIAEHIENVETTLGLKRTKNEKEDDAAPYWDHWDAEYRSGFPSVEDEILCQTVEKHNNWVRWLYTSIAAWATAPVAGGEVITPDDAKGFWHGLSLLSVNPDRWTREYYVARMEHLYEVMRGRESEGVSFDTKPLSAKQAAAVIGIFETYLDRHDMRLDVPRDRDFLASSYDGGYDWCEHCGAVTPEDGDACTRRKCPLRESRS